MASAILILLWIQNELSYDQFHENKNRIYEAWNRAERNGKVESWTSTPKVLAKTIQNDFPEVENAGQYKGEERFGKLFLNFAVLAIIISSLGLLGLASYSTLQRTKEIGIRKVLGASVSGIVNLLSLDFLKLVIISFAIAAPLAWYFMYKWLQDFAYHTNVGFWVFVLAGFCALAIALLTVSFQAIKAAIANPVKSLRTE